MSAFDPHYGAVLDGGAMASEAEPLFQPGPAIAPAASVRASDKGAQRWIEARAAVLERFRGMSKWAAWAKACEEFDSFQGAE